MRPTFQGRMGRGPGGAENLEQTVQGPLRGELSGRESDCHLTGLHREKSAGSGLGLGFDPLFRLWAPKMKVVEYRGLWAGSHPGT